MASSYCISHKGLKSYKKGNSIVWFKYPQIFNKTIKQILETEIKVNRKNIPFGETINFNLKEFNLFLKNVDEILSKEDHEYIGIFESLIRVSEGIYQFGATETNNFNEDEKKIKQAISKERRKLDNFRKLSKHFEHHMTEHGKEEVFLQLKIIESTLSNISNSWTLQTFRRNQIEQIYGCLKILTKGTGVTNNAIESFICEMLGNHRLKDSIKGILDAYRKKRNTNPSKNKLVIKL